MRQIKNSETHLSRAAGGVVLIAVLAGALAIWLAEVRVVPANSDIADRAGQNRPDTGIETSGSAPKNSSSDPGSGSSSNAVSSGAQPGANEPGFPPAETVAPDLGTGLPPYPDQSPHPEVPWDATEAELRALSDDTTAPASQRTEARARLQLNFPRWRGRAGGTLGGFSFDPASYPALDGWEAHASPIHVAASLVPPRRVQRDVTFTKGEGYLTLRIHVFLSAGWAHEYMVERLLSGVGGSPPKWGDELGISVGDVWFSGSKLPYRPIGNGQFKLIRRNVVVEASFAGAENGDGRLFDVMAFAADIDKEIGNQGHVSNNWADLKAVCPLIKEFQVDDPVRLCNSAERWPPPGPDGTTSFGPWKLRLQVEPRPGMELEFFNPNDDVYRTVFLSGSKAPGASSSRLVPPYDGVYINRKAAIERLKDADSLETAVWLMVVDKKSLLFSVAKIDLTLKR